MLFRFLIYLQFLVHQLIEIGGKHSMACIIILITLNINSAQNKKLVFEHYDFNRKFYSNSCFDIVKARNGYVWLATDQGLLKYDGHQFKNYTYDPDNSNSISSNYTRLIKEDKHGRIWIAADDQMDVYDVLHDRFYHLKYIDENFQEQEIWCNSILYEAEEDKMTIVGPYGTFQNIGYDLKMLKINADSIISRDLNTIIKDSNNNYWIGSKDGYWCYDNCFNQISAFNSPLQNPAILHDEGIITSYIDDHQILWLGTWGNGLIKHNILSGKSQQFLFGNPKYVFNLVPAIIKSPLPYENHILWIGTSDKLQSFNTITNTFSEDIDSSFNQDFKNAASIWKFTLTSTEGLWIGSGKYLHRFDPKMQKFEYREINIENKEALQYQVNPLFIEKGSNQVDSIFWVFVPYYGLYKYDYVNKKVLNQDEILRKFNLKYKYTEVYCIDSKKRIWFSTADHNLLVYDFMRGKEIQIDHEDLKDNSASFLEIEEGNDGTIWLGSFQGLYKINLSHPKDSAGMGKGNSLIKVKEVNDFILSNNLFDNIFQIEIDSKGTIWLVLKGDGVKKQNAILYYQPDNHFIKALIREDSKILKTLNFVEGIYVTKQGKLVMTSFNGIALCDANSDFSNQILYTTKDALLNNNTRYVAEDIAGNLWLSSPNGISCLNPNTGNFYNLSNEHFDFERFDHCEFHYSTEKNILYALSFNRIHILNLDSLMKNDKPVIRFNFIQLGSRYYNSEQGTLNKIKLKHDENEVLFNYTILSFTNSQQNQYKYILEGAETRWSKEHTNQVHYSGLAPGNYTFRVKGINYLGIESENELQLNFEIIPPFWKSWWFISIVFILIIMMVFGLFLYRELQNRRLEKLRLSIAQDLHDEMGSNLSNIKMLSEFELLKSPEKYTATFQKIAERTGKVMDSMAEIVWSINPKNDDLNAIVYKIQEFAIEILEPKGVQLHFDIIGEINKVKLSLENRRHFFLIFKELINNTAKYSGASEVWLKVHIKNSTIISGFYDNGKGFDFSVIYSGNGLKNIQERAKLLKGKIHIESSDNGTSINLIIPI